MPCFPEKSPTFFRKEPYIFHKRALHLTMSPAKELHNTQHILKVEDEQHILTLSEQHRRDEEVKTPLSPRTEPYSSRKRAPYLSPNALHLSRSPAKEPQNTQHILKVEHEQRIVTFLTVFSRTFLTVFSAYSHCILTSVTNFLTNFSHCILSVFSLYSLKCHELSHELFSLYSQRILTVFSHGAVARKR